MGKNRIRKQIPYYISRDSLLDGTIEQVQENLSNLKRDVLKVYPEWETIFISVDLEWDYGDQTIAIKLHGERDETDEEQAARIATSRKKSIAAKAAATKRANLQKEKDYQTYLKLQEKFKDV